MKKFVTHFKLWNKWRKNSGNGFIYKLLVLFNLVISPTFELWYRERP